MGCLGVFVSWALCRDGRKKSAEQEAEGRKRDFVTQNYSNNKEEGWGDLATSLSSWLRMMRLLRRGESQGKGEESGGKSEKSRLNYSVPSARIHTAHVY